MKYSRGDWITSAAKGGFGDPGMGVFRTHIPSIKSPSGPFYFPFPRPCEQARPSSLRKNKKPPLARWLNRSAMCSVGETGFEPATTCTPYKCATGLRYSPKRLKVGCKGKFLMELAKLGKQNILAPTKYKHEGTHKGSKNR